MNTIPKPAVMKVVLFQGLLLISVSGFVLLFDTEIAVSIALGGLIQLIPQAWFTRQAFKYAGANQATAIVRSMYRGETGKLILTACGFVAVFITIDDLNVIALMSAFITMLSVQILLLAKVFNQ
jgi:ATP synthase protein I